MKALGRRFGAAIAWAGATTGSVAGVASDSRGSSAAEVAEAREDFQRGARLAGERRWPEALAAFEHSTKLRRHAVTTFNVGVCERALGRETLARGTFTLALSEDEAAIGKLPEVLVDDAHKYIDEIDRALVVLDVRVELAGAAVDVDGSPLLVRSPRGDPAGARGGGVAIGPWDRTAGAGLSAPHRSGTSRVQALLGRSRALGLTATFAAAARASIDLRTDGPPASARPL